MTLRKTLGQLGYRPAQIQEAEDGDQALAAFSAFQPDLVFLDIMMPGRDGEATARSILEQDPEAKVVFLTGVSRDDERVRRMISDGVFEHIEKPIRLESVRQVLETLQREQAGYGRIR